MGCAASSNNAKGFALFATLDERLVMALASGAIKLLRTDFLLAEDVCGNQILRRSALENMEIDQKIQIFLSPEEAAMAVLLNKRIVGALSYVWTSVDHPDDSGAYLAAVRRFLRCKGVGQQIKAIFWDYACLPPPPRSRREAKVTQLAATPKPFSLASPFVLRA